MGRLEDIVGADSLEALERLRAESGVDTVLEEKATPIQRAVAAARARGREERASSGDDERDYTRDTIGRFSEDGERDSEGGKRRTANGGVDRDGDGDSDPALGKEGYARIGSLEDVGRQIAGWLDNVPVEKRREQRFRLLARAAELGASDEVLQKIRALPAPDEKKDHDVSTMETKTPASATPAGLEHKTAASGSGVQVLETDDETGIVTALVSVTGVVDNVKDQIEPGAYTKTMMKREPIGVWSHDDKTWVARTEEAVELPPGHPELLELKTMDGQPWDPAAGAVKVTARFNLDTPHGAAAYSDVKFFKGKTGWSIGYRATKAHRNPRTGVRHIKELDWFEYSPVMVGAASQPMTLSVKSLAGAYAVDAEDDTGLVDDGMLEELTLDELDRLDALKASLGLEVKARVRTPEGARRYGQPIGSVIIPDAVSGSVGAKEITSGMEVDFQGMGAGGPSDPVAVSGKVEKVSRDGNITTVTVGGKDHKLIGNSPVKVTGGKGADANAALSDKDLVTMLQEAEDDEERKLIRAAAALPAEKRRAFLTSGGKDGDAAGGDKPTASSAAAKRFEGQKMTPGNAARVLKDHGLSDTHEAVPDTEGDGSMVRIQPKKAGAAGGAADRPLKRSGGVPIEQEDGPRRDAFLSKQYADHTNGDLADEIESYEDMEDTDRNRTIIASLKDEQARRKKVESDATALTKELQNLDPKSPRGLQVQAKLDKLGGKGGGSGDGPAPGTYKGPGRMSMAVAKDGTGTMTLTNGERRHLGKADVARTLEGSSWSKTSSTASDTNADPRRAASRPGTGGNAGAEAAVEKAEKDFPKGTQVTFRLGGEDRTGKVTGHYYSPTGARATVEWTDGDQPMKTGLNTSALSKDSGGGKGGKPEQPTNDKGESVSDFVSSVLSDLRDEDYKQLESDVQAALDAFEKNPTQANAAALSSVLKPINEDGVDGENIEEALDLLAKVKAGGDAPAAPSSSDRADRARQRARDQDAEADARVKERAKLAALNKRRRAQGKTPLLRLPDNMKALDLGEHTDDELEVKVGEAVEAGDVAFGDPDLEEKGSRASLDRSPRKNWVENAGELPPYVREVARAVEREQGLPLDRAIPIAIGRIKKWAKGGGGVKADTVAKAAAAVAQWEALKARSGKKYDSELLEDIEHKALERMDLIEQLEADGVYSVELKALADDNAALGAQLAELGDVLEEKAGEPLEVGVDPELVELLARGAEVKGFGTTPVDDDEDFGDLLGRRAALGI